MTAVIPDLWPDVKLDTIAPKTILDQQVEYIRARYAGYLDAIVTTVTGEDEFVIHRFDLIAVQLDGMRVRILTATHRGEYYPVQIEAECYRRKTRTFAGGILEASSIKTLTGQNTPHVQSLTWPPEGDWRPIAWDQTAFITKVGEVLKSGEVRSVMESIIARSNEKQLLAEPMNAAGETAKTQPTGRALDI